MPGISYSSLLLLIAAAASVLVLLYLMRNRWRSQPDGLQALIEEAPETGSQQRDQLVIPLLVYEERFPSFGRILRLVLARFPIEDFLQEDEFRQAIHFLSESISKPRGEDKVAASMCLIVRTFISNPNVEYRCRPRLQELLDQFLDEIELQPAARQKPSQHQSNN